MAALPPSSLRQEVLAKSRCPWISEKQLPNFVFPETVLPSRAQHLAMWGCRARDGKGGVHLLVRPAPGQTCTRPAPAIFSPTNYRYFISSLLHSLPPASLPSATKSFSLSDLQPPRCRIEAMVFVLKPIPYFPLRLSWLCEQCGEARSLVPAAP